MPLTSEDEGVRCLTDLTLKVLPHHGGYPIAIFLQLSKFDPVFEAKVVNVLDSTSASARRKQRIDDRGLTVPAKSALRILNDLAFLIFVLP